MLEQTDSKKRILVIDDEEIVLHTICTILAKLGYEPIRAHGGRRGMELLNGSPVDMVLVDLLMPDVDGYEIISTCKERFPDMPVVAVSGVDVVNEAIKAIRLGAWDYLLKPITKLEVFKMNIDRSLERAELLQQNSRYKNHLERMNAELKETLYKLEEDEKSGRRIQQQLLPLDIQMFGGYECSRSLIPSTFLSGDFLDYFAIGDHHLGFYIADVSGHGVSSAFVTVLLKSFMYSYQKNYADDGDESILHPRKILLDLNREILEQNIEKYLTIFYGVIDLKTNTLTCSNGGQYPFPILFDGDKAGFLRLKGFPIGVFDFSDYEETAIKLPQNFALYFISDGILDTLHLDTPQEKNNLLLSRIDGADISLMELMERFGIAENKSYPDDITFLKVMKNA